MGALQSRTDAGWTWCTAWGGTEMLHQHLNEEPSPGLNWEWMVTKRHLKPRNLKRSMDIYNGGKRPGSGKSQSWFDGGRSSPDATTTSPRSHRAAFPSGATGRGCLYTHPLCVCLITTCNYNWDYRHVLRNLQVFTTVLWVSCTVPYLWHYWYWSRMCSSLIAS